MPPSPTRRMRRMLLPAVTVMCLLGLTACGSSSDTSDAGAAGDEAGTTTLTLYSGQHEDLAKALAAGFEADSGIRVEVRSGKDAELVNQIVEEGDRSKADVILTEEPGPIAQLGAKGRLAEVDAATFDDIDERLVPADGTWLPIAARSRAVFYNPTKIAEGDLPESILDLADPKWKGRFAYAPSGAFTSTVSYLINAIGEEKTLAWLEAIKANGVNEQKNGKVRDTVEAGQHEFGLSNHYYWYLLAAEKGGADKVTSRVHHIPGGDAGALLLASGAGVLKSSDDAAAGQRFLAWLARADGGQKVIAETTPQYPLAKGVQSSHDLKPLGELEPPTVDQGSLGNVEAAKALILKSGIV